MMIIVSCILYPERMLYSTCYNSLLVGLWHNIFSTWTQISTYELTIWHSVCNWIRNHLTLRCCCKHYCALSSHCMWSVSLSLEIKMFSATLQYTCTGRCQPLTCWINKWRVYMDMFLPEYSQYRESVSRRSLYLSDLDLVHKNIL